MPMPACRRRLPSAGRSRSRSKSSWLGAAEPDLDRSIPPAGLEPAASGLRVRRHSKFDHRGLRALLNHPSGDTRRADAGFAGVGRTRPDRRRLTDRSHHGSAKPSRTSIGYSGGRDRTCASRLTVARLTRSTTPERRGGGSRIRTCMAASHRRVSSALPFQVGDASRRKERESNPQGRSPPVFETGYRTRWQSFRKVTPAGLEPARRRLRVGRSTELSYGARDVVGRSRTCNAPRFKRALYLLELRPREWARLESNPATPQVTCKTSARPF